METVGVRHGGVKHSLHILLHSLIDYAGLFPPAGLKMSDAVANYRTYKNGSNSWALGRFIVPAARLEELEAEFVPDHEIWHLSALIGQNPAEDLAHIAEFNGRHRRSAIVDSVEAKVSNAAAIRELKRQVPESLLIYFEIPGAGDPTDLIGAIGAAGARAKVRTGGLTPEMFPSEQQVLHFLSGCVRENVAFKATAGLHHPVRCIKPLTYEKDAPRGAMHGFLNVFLAAAFLLEGSRQSDLEKLLLEGDPGNFEFDEDAITWCGHRVTQARLLESRALAASFGSCSFEEPVGDLVALNLL